MGDCLSSPLPCLSLSLLPSAGEAHRIFEMCFDHQSSEKALIFYWPEMKGIRCKNPSAKGYLDLQVMFLFVSFFHPVKRGDLDIIKRRIPKRKAFGLWSFSNVLLGEARRWNSMSAFRASMNPCHQPSSISLPRTFAKFDFYHRADTNAR